MGPQRIQNSRNNLENEMKLEDKPPDFQTYYKAAAVKTNGRMEETREFGNRRIHMYQLIFNWGGKVSPMVGGKEF